MITFEDLIRLRMISFLRARGYSYAHITQAEDFVRRELHVPQPFVSERFWLGGPILMEFEDVLVSVSPGREWQTAFRDLREFMLPVEHGLSFSGGVASLWRPFDRVVIDPGLQFGSPCIEGTRVETEALWSFYQAGDSAESLARLYGLNIEQVRAALGWEERLAAAMAG